MVDRAGRGNNVKSSSIEDLCVEFGLSESEVRRALLLYLRTYDKMARCCEHTGSLGEDRSVGRISQAPSLTSEDQNWVAEAGLCLTGWVW